MNSNYKDNKHEIKFSNNWIITYSDMITIVLCFFILFFTYTAEETSILYDIKQHLSLEVEELSSQVEELSEENIVLKQEKESLAAILFGLEDIEVDILQSQEEFIRYLREKHLLDLIDIEQSDVGLLIRFKDSVLFSSGRAEISEDGHVILNHIGDKLKQIDNKIVVAGYTDNVPMNSTLYPSNWELSVARAMNAARVLMEEKTIAEERISVSGYGENQPIDTNDTPEGRSNNRRIEITILN
ncbi:chemotaxis protein MotB [Natronincola peptidivorans]|uniref:Chemotaxis protein MotB n=1 Tax=Natronincola peptidivorans TaxID=426128 RepID=A0A1I0DYZ0_9FIRM|nr:flagellar motor protein MotB [Natronincola peptidivorans]SET37672.1 chemotaxis protein MotB [Natronincola peptidivorans]